MRPWHMWLGLAAATNIVQYLTPFPTCVYLFIPLLMFVSLAGYSAYKEG